MGGTVVLKATFTTVLERDAAGNDANATSGLHVYLSRPDGTPPGSPKGPPPPARAKNGPPPAPPKFKFAHFTVDATGRLMTTAAKPAPFKLETSTNYWCFTSGAAIPELEDAGKPKEVDFGVEIAGVYPLPTQFVIDKSDPKKPVTLDKLVLPEERSANLRCLDATGVPTTDPDYQKVILDELSSAIAFYKKLKISFKLGATPVERPLAKGFWSLRRKKDIILDPSGPGTPVFYFMHEHTDPSDTTGTEMVPGPNMAGATFGPADPKTTLLIVWVRTVQDFTDPQTGGIAWPHCPITGARANIPRYALPDTGVINMPFYLQGSKTPNATGGFNLRHEIGHCMLHDPGLGLNFTTQAGQPAVATFLKSLGVGADHDRDLFFDPHVSAKAFPTNLMVPTGGKTFLPWQIATIRASEILRPSAGLM